MKEREKVNMQDILKNCPRAFYKGRRDCVDVEHRQRHSAAMKQGWVRVGLGLGLTFRIFFDCQTLLGNRVIRYSRNVKKEKVTIK